MIKIALWGTGVITASIMKQLRDGVDVIGLIDNDPNKHGTLFNGKKVFSPEMAPILAECDYVLLLMSSYAQDVYEQLTVRMGFSRDKILSLGPCWDAEGNRRNYRILQSVMMYDEKTDPLRIHSSNFFLHRKMEWDRYRTGGRSAADERLFGSDYTRFRTFELCAEETLKIKSRKMENSSVAEVGVFRGEFASLINAAYKDKTLYLFDTFEGFNSEEYSKEKISEGVDAENVNFFRNTSVDLVLQRMPHLDKCVIRKGDFPDTAAGLENETFCFVSIDVDLTDPIYNSLVYFYPRLVAGGYLFVHEYNHGHYTGVKKAVERFEAENGFLRKMPLADNNGTLIITK